jgi:hypothetical protein
MFFNLDVYLNTATVNVGRRPYSDALRILTEGTNLFVRRGIRFEMDVGLSKLSHGSAPASREFNTKQL